MSEAVSHLLNTLESFTACASCKASYEIEINLKCGHNICKGCKNKRKKCPSCFADLSASRKTSSVLFIEELREELLKRSTGADNGEKNVEEQNNDKIILLENGEKKSINEEIKKSEEHLEGEDDVIFIGETRTPPNESCQKRNKDKERVVFYGKIDKKEEESQVKIDLATIGQEVNETDCKNCINASEIEWNGHLNSIISRLNSQSSEEGDSKILNSNSPLILKVTIDNSARPRESQDGCVTIIKMSPIKNGSKFQKTDLKRKTNNFSSGCSNSSPKRKKMEESNSTYNITVNISKEGFSDKTKKSPKFLNNKSFTSISDKMLGGIVDETEIVKRYLNDSLKDETARCTNNKNEKAINAAQSCFIKINESTKRSKSLNDLKDTRILNGKCDDRKKCETINKFNCPIVTDLDCPDESLSSGEEELEADILASMLNNVSKEIMVVGKTLCAYPSSDTSCDLVSSKPSSSSFQPVIENLPIVKEHHNEREHKNQVVEHNDFCVATTTVKDKSLETSSTKTKIKPQDCAVVVENFAPKIFKSTGGNIIRLNKFQDISGLTLYMPEKKVEKKNNSIEISPSKPISHICEDSPNGFEGFTEQDILMLIVKLALFKMNGCKYSDGLSSSNLYNIDGKQILITDISQGSGYSEFSSVENKSSDMTIEISDSEDESLCNMTSSSVQTENDIAITPSPSTSRLRPISLAKLCGFERASEKFTESDELDTRDPLSPDTPLLGRHMHRTPVSRRQLSFISPPFERYLQSHNLETKPCSSKDVGDECDSDVNDEWKIIHHRVQCNMPDFLQGSEHNEFEHSTISPTRLTFTTCCLNSKETALVTKLANITNSCLTKDFTHATTHLIVGANGRGSLEYYLAIAYRAFIVSMDWVSLCIALNKILPVTGFILTEDEGPLKCLEPISPPFVGFYICSKILPNANSNYPIAEITKTLLSLGEARLLSDIDAFQTLQDTHLPRFFVYSANSQMTPAVIDKCASMRIVPVQFMWVYESVSAFRALPVMDYLGTVIHSRTLVRDYRVPEHLACSRYPRLEANHHPQILDERYQRSL